MHIKALKQLLHHHHFEAFDPNSKNRTLIVVLMTAFMMVIEIVAGSIFGSMALLADGWHMGNNAGAL